MKKIIILFFLLLLSGCAAGKQEKTIISQEAMQDVSCESKENTKEKEKCYLKMAKEKEEILYCNNIVATPLMRDSCYMELSVIKKDLGICENMLLDEYNKDKDTCYFNYATKLGEIEVCDKIKAKKTKDACKKTIKGM